MAKRANGEGAIYKRQDGKWEMQFPTDKYYPGGRRKMVRASFDTQREAKKALTEKERQRDAGLALSQAPTLIAHLDSWLETTIAPRREKKTILFYAGAIKRVRGSAIAKSALDKLTPAQIDEFLLRLRASGREDGQPLAATTVDAVRRMLRAALNKAMKQGLVARNVATLSETVPGQKKEIEVYTVDEVNQLLDTVAGERLEAAYYIAVLMGLRVGELLGLPWKHVDLAKGILRVRQQLESVNGGTPTIKEYTKTASGRRDLDIPDDVLVVLRAHKDRQRIEANGREHWNVEGLVLPSVAGTPIFPRNFARQFELRLKRADLPIRNPHVLRHTAATLMIARGLPLEKVSSILGHASVDFTKRTYVHWLPTDTRHLSTAMAGFRRPAAAAQ